MAAEPPTLSSEVELLCIKGKPGDPALGVSGNHHPRKACPPGNWVKSLIYNAIPVSRPSGYLVTTHLGKRAPLAAGVNLFYIADKLLEARAGVSVMHELPAAFTV